MFIAAAALKLLAAVIFDFGTLPQGDETNVGSDGISLSGGQKQRISLARALYLQTHFLVLDDVFSGLDADTEEQVFRKVFGPAGLLRRRQTTVLLYTHSVRHLQAADYIIALGDGSVILKTLFRAPLRFFTETDTGVTTNLFSQDLNLIDTELPDTTVNTLFAVG